MSNPVVFKYPSISAPEINEEKRHKAKTFSKLLNSPMFVAEILHQRGIHEVDEARDYFLARMEEYPENGSLKNFDEIIARLLLIQERQKSVVIHGDYDVDGIAGSALLYRALKLCGFKVDWFLPNRFEDGYGLSLHNMDKLREKGCDWIISVDTGITAVAEVERAQELGMGVIITDHHQAAETLPDTPFILNPNQPGCAYPNKGLCGAGLAYKVAEELIRKIKGQGAEGLLDLVAIASLADIAPMVGENRTLVRRGLRNLQYTQNMGLKALLIKSGLYGSDGLLASDVLFKLTPLLNSAGRLDSPEIAMKLLITSDAREAKQLAEQLWDLNQQRKQLDLQVFEEASQFGMEQTGNAAIIARSKDWHEGVIGISAARLVDKYRKPSLVMSITDGVAKGSGRSIPGINLHQALSKCSQYLDKWGGHYMACGFTLAEEKIEAFSESFQQAVFEMGKELEEFKIKPHVEVGLHEVTEESLIWLKRMEPTGPKNEPVLFYSKDLYTAGEIRIVGEKHLKFNVSNGTRRFDAIAFGYGDMYEELLQAEKINLAYHMEVNEFQGVRRLQLRVVALECIA